MQRLLAVLPSLSLLVGCGGQPSSSATGPDGTRPALGPESAQTFNREDPAHDVV